MKNLLLVLVVLFFAPVHAQEKYINVTGTSELILNADQIDFNVQIKVVKESVKESKQANDEYVNQLLKMLKDEGIKQDDMEVSPITLGRNYVFTRGERTQKGFYAQVNVSFKLKDLAKYYDLTDKLAANDNFEVLGSGYNISNYEAQNKKAYENALKAAKEKAEYMCKTLGLTLGEVTEIDETGNPQPYPGRFNTLSKEINQNENPFGKVTINRSIRVKFEIK